MQAASDIFLGWQRVMGLRRCRRDYYVRQLHDGKGSVDIEAYHARPAWSIRAAVRLDTGPCPCPFRRPDRDRRIPGRGQRFDIAMADFAAAYADQNERDYATFQAAVDAGRLDARTGL